MVGLHKVCILCKVIIICLSFSFLYLYIHICMHPVIDIGFKDEMYGISEEEGSISFEVEVKNGGASAIPIDFIVDDTEGEALSKFSYFLDLLLCTC